MFISPTLKLKREIRKCPVTFTLSSSHITEITGVNQRGESERVLCATV